MLLLRDHLPTRSVPGVNYALLALNVVVYGAEAWATAGGVAFAAHVGGFVAGLALLPLMRREEPVAYDPWERLLRPR